MTIPYFVKEGLDKTMKIITSDATEHTHTHSVQKLHAETQKNAECITESKTRHQEIRGCFQA
jgi:hypothetical protein